MRTVKFFKYDLRRCKHLFLMSVILFAPLGAMMGYNMESVLGCFSYMALVVVIAPTTLFTYEQKVDCGFDGLLPATDSNRVFGRYLLGAVSVVFQLLLGVIISVIVSEITGLKVSDLSVVSMIFIASTLIYLSVAFVFYYFIGRNLNQQIKSAIIMVPCLAIWFAANAVIALLTDEDVVGVLAKIMENIEIISALALVFSVAMYVISALISVQIVKRKDYR